MMWEPQRCQGSWGFEGRRGSGVLGVAGVLGCLGVTDGVLQCVLCLFLLSQLLAVIPTWAKPMPGPPI